MYQVFANEQLFRKIWGTTFLNVCQEGLLAKIQFSR
jgi:hypothetical protein